MKKYLIFLLIVVLTFGICLVGCKNEKDNVVRLNEVTHSVFYAPLYVAINQGFFEDEGITIELTNGGGSDKSMTAVMSGQADIGLMGPETAVYVRLGGSKNYPVVFGQLTRKDGSFLIGRSADPDFSWQDLRGKEIIGGRQGGMPAMMLEYALYANGLTEGQDVTINYDVQFDLITAAFEGGTGDYCTMFEPNATEYQAAGKGHVITSVGAAMSDVPYTCFMATQSYLREKPDTVKAFMRAVMRGIDYVTEQDDATIAAALQPSFPSTSIETLKNAVRAYKAIDAYKTSPVMSEAEFNTLLDVLMFAGSIDRRVAFTDIIDNTIAQSIADAA